MDSLLVEATLGIQRWETGELLVPKIKTLFLAQICTNVASESYRDSPVHVIQYSGYPRLHRHRWNASSCQRLTDESFHKKKRRWRQLIPPKQYFHTTFLSFLFLSSRYLSFLFLSFTFFLSFPLVLFPFISLPSLSIPFLSHPFFLPISNQIKSNKIKSNQINLH